MDILTQINWITATMACLFIIPVLAGMLRPFSSERVQSSVMSLVDVLELLLSIILSLYFTRVILTDANNPILSALYSVFPSLQGYVEDKNIWVYLIFIVALLFIADGILHLITMPFYKFAVVPLSEKIAVRTNKMRSVPRRIVGGLWQLPRSILFVLMFSILLSLLTSFFGNTAFADYVQASKPYMYIEENAVGPLLNTGVVHNIQVLLSDSFKRDNSKSGLSGLQLVHYFNGVTLDDAVKSTGDITAAAQKAVGTETSPRQKAYLIYKWICRNIEYDNNKARQIAVNSTSVESGAAVCFNTKKGVCFDFSALYVAMCRAVDVKVRFITGMGYSGSSWGDHAWNQAYDAAANKWVNVDTTFGSAGMNYFDRDDFNLDHADAVVQQEW